MEPTVADLRRGCKLLGDDFDEGAVGEGVGTEDVDDAVAGEASEHGGLRWSQGWLCWRRLVRGGVLW